MKAKKIVTRIPEEPQEVQRPASCCIGWLPRRRTTRHVYVALIQTKGGIEALRTSTESAGQIQEATKALFTTIENAQNALLSLTGAPGIISQGEITAVRAMQYEYMNRSFAERMAVQHAPD